MKKYYYKRVAVKKEPNPRTRKIIHYGGVLLAGIGVGILIYFTAPILTWKLFFSSAFASVTAPVPDPYILTPEGIKELIHKNQNKGVIVEKDGISDKWFMQYPFKKTTTPSVAFYEISIPKLSIYNAEVATEDSDLSKHLVQYWGTPLPPLRGNAVIFGHSTLPSLFRPNDYKTIFANAHTLKNGDTIIVNLGKESYTYRIIKIFVTEPDDISVLDQDTSGNYFTLITCTPPGTIWKRLIIKSQLVTD